MALNKGAVLGEDDLEVPLTLSVVLHQSLY